MRIVLKYYVPFADFLSKIKNTQIDNAKDIDVVMAMYILIEHLFKNIRNFMAIGKRSTSFELCWLYCCLFCCW